MAPVPFLIEFSESAWVTSVAALQIGAVDFLLNSLRYNFPTDYDRNQQTREGSMQRALRSMLTAYLPGLLLIDNVAVRRGGNTITDIDFAAIDETDGTVVLFQLKHQDHYGGDMRRRSNRAARLRKEVAHWLESTRTWIAEEEPSAIKSALRLKGDFPISRIYLLVIARHFAHFLSSLDMRDDAAYATWIQLFDALNRLRFEDRPRTLVGLFKTLEHFMSHKMAKGFELDQLDSYHLRGLSYRIRPAAAE